MTFKGLRVAIWLGLILPGLIFPSAGAWAANDRGSASGPAEIVVVKSGDKPVYGAALTALQQDLPPHTRLVSHSLTEWRRLSRTANHGKADRMLVAIGALATEELLPATTDQPLLSMMVPSTTFAQLISRSRHAAQRVAQQQLAAIYMDQPARRQINLARLIQPEVKTLGTLYDAGSRQLVRSIGVAAAHSDLQFLARQLEEADNPLRALRDLYSRIDIYIAVPGEFVFNRSIAKWMLYLSLRNKKPLLGFSEEFVHAGAIAAVYSTPQDIGRQAAETIKKFYSAGRFVTSDGYPVYFRVSANRSVARLLGLELTSDDLLTAELGRQELLP